MILPPFDVDRLYGAIGERFSTRAYDGLPVQNEEYQKVCEKVGASLFNDARAVFVEQVPQGFFKGIIGSYFSIEGAQSALVFICDKTVPFSLFHVGYLGEALVLEATAQRIDSCWIAGSFSPDVAGQTVELGANEEIVAVAALGNGSASRGKRKRKKLELIGPGYKQWPTWAKAGLEAVQTAPSGMNRQPWKLSFNTETSEVKLVAAGPAIAKLADMQQIDCGIAALHFELGAAVSDTHGVWAEVTNKHFVFKPANPVFSSEYLRRSAESPVKLKQAPAGSYRTKVQE